MGIAGILVSFRIVLELSMKQVDNVPRMSQ